MKALLLALTLVNAPATEQDLMLADLCDADPRLAYEVLDVADELGADTNELAIVIAIIADSTGGEDYSVGQVLFDPEDDSTKNPDTSKWDGGEEAATAIYGVQTYISDAIINPNCSSD